MSLEAEWRAVPRVHLLDGLAEAEATTVPLEVAQRAVRPSTSWMVGLKQLRPRRPRRPQWCSSVQGGKQFARPSPGRSGRGGAGGGGSGGRGRAPQGGNAQCQASIPWTGQRCGRGPWPCPSRRRGARCRRIAPGCSGGEKGGRVPLEAVRRAVPCLHLLDRAAAVAEASAFLHVVTPHVVPSFTSWMPGHRIIE